MNLPTWNLNEFYSSFKDKQINKDLHSLKKKISLFSIKYKGKLGKLKNQQLIRSLIEFEKIEEIILKLRSYAYLVYCTDQLNNDKAKFYQYIEESVLDCEKDVIFYGIELNKLSDNKTSVVIATDNVIYQDIIRESFKKDDHFEKLVEKTNDRFLGIVDVVETKYYKKALKKNNKSVFFVFNKK